MHVNELTRTIINAAMEVHSALGPGLLESAYEACLVYELRKQGMQVENQVVLPVIYKEVRVDVGYRLDLLIEDTVIVELKCVEDFASIHTAQLLSYLKLSDKPVGLLINFHVTHLRDGIKRIVNGTEWKHTFVTSVPSVVKN